MSEAEATEALMELGLREYEARCFVALTQLSEGTAKEISQVADVPQSRVYDVVDQLHRRGIVDVQESDPRKYFAMPVELARKRLSQEYRDHLETATTHLHELESRETDDDGAWKIANHRDVRNRTIMHIERATEEVYLVLGHDDLLEDELLEVLADVTDDVAIYVEVPSESARDRLHEAVPESNVAVSTLPLESTAVEGREPGRLLVVDHETVLLSARTEGLVPSETEETGLWGRTVGHGLVVWLRSLVEARRQTLAFERADE